MTYTNPVIDGTKSVKFNKSALNGNSAYINTTLQLDHYFNEDAQKDGHHKYVQLTNYTVGGSPDDPAIAAGLDSVLYLKTTNTRNELFHRNSDGIYQVTPSFKSGTVSINGDGSTYSTLTSVPANVYGEIFMYTTALGQYSVVTGVFRSNATTVESFAIPNLAQASTSSTNPYAAIPLKFGNGSQASGLNIRARKGNGASGTWNYRITYRAL